MTLAERLEALRQEIIRRTDFTARETQRDTGDKDRRRRRPTAAARTQPRKQTPMTHTINVPLARQVLTQIMDAPRRWNQDIWLDRPYLVDQQSATDTSDEVDCETTGCFAGWAVVLDGWKTSTHGTRVVNGTPELHDKIAAIWRVADAFMTEDDVSFRAEYPDVQATAAAALGLNYGQQAALFHHTNSLHTIFAYLGDWTEGEIAMPADADQPAWFHVAGNHLNDWFDDQDYAAAAARGA
jgi:hypothetical protein